MIKQYYQRLSLYYLIFFGILSFFKNSLIKNLQTTLIVGLIVFLIIFPWIIILIADKKPAFSKWLRVSLFFTLRVSTFAKTSFIILIFLCFLLIYNYSFSNVSINQILVYLLFINLILLFFITLLLNGRFHINDRLGLLIRQIRTLEIYLYKDGALRHIPDPPTLQLLGYSFSDVNDISSDEFSKYIQKPALESISSGRLVRANNQYEVYIILDGEKRHVPDPLTLLAIQQYKSKEGQNNKVEILSEDDVSKWPTGKPLVRVT